MKYGMLNICATSVGRQCGKGRRHVTKRSISDAMMRTRRHSRARARHTGRSRRVTIFDAARLPRHALAEMPVATFRGSSYRRTAHCGDSDAFSQIFSRRVNTATAGSHEEARGLATQQKMLMAPRERQETKAYRRRPMPHYYVCRPGRGHKRRERH